MNNTDIKIQSPEERYSQDPEPISLWFELSYAQYLTIPRSVLQAMPQEWQAKMAVLLDQVDETIDWRPKEGKYWVKLKDAAGRYVHDSLMEYRRPEPGAIVYQFKSGYTYHCHHKPSGEDWHILGIDVKGNRVCAAGWPATKAKFTDCENFCEYEPITQEELDYRTKNFGENWI